MVRNCVRKTTRGEWSQESMEKAVSDVVKGKMSYKLAAMTYSVPQTTLERKVKMSRETGYSVKNVKSSLGPKQCIFTMEEEAELVDYLKGMESRLFGITTMELRRLAFELAVKNGKNHTFKRENGLAGKDWVAGSLKRHPDLSIRKPEKTSAARAAAFNQVSG